MYKKFQKAGNARYYAKPYARLYTYMKRNAASRGHQVTLTYEQYRKIAETSPKCHYCHRKLKWIKHGPKAYNVNLDRKNAKLGYTPRNVVACCWQCNNAKSNVFSYNQWWHMTAPFRRGIL